MAKLEYLTAREIVITVTIGAALFVHGLPAASEIVVKRESHDGSRVIAHQAHPTVAHSTSHGDYAEPGWFARYLSVVSFST